VVSDTNQLEGPEDEEDVIVKVKYLSKEEILTEYGEQLPDHQVVQAGSDFDIDKSNNESFADLDDFSLDFNEDTNEDSDSGSDFF
jgi:hypothetical protein